MVGFLVIETETIEYTREVVNTKKTQSPKILFKEGFWGKEYRWIIKTAKLPVSIANKIIIPKKRKKLFSVLNLVCYYLKRLLSSDTSLQQLKSRKMIR